MDPKIVEALVPVLATALLAAIGWIVRDWIIRRREARSIQKLEGKQTDADRVKRAEALVAALGATYVPGVGVNREKWDFGKIQEIWDESRRLFDAESLKPLNEKLISARSQLEPNASDEEYRAFNEAAEAFIKALSDKIKARS